MPQITSTLGTKLNLMFNRFGAEFNAPPDTI